MPKIEPFKPSSELAVVYCWKPDNGTYSKEGVPGNLQEGKGNTICWDSKKYGGIVGFEITSVTEIHDGTCLVLSGVPNLF